MPIRLYPSIMIDEMASFLSRYDPDKTLSIIASMLVSGANTPAYSIVVFRAMIIYHQNVYTGLRAENYNCSAIRGVYVSMMSRSSGRDTGFSASDYL